MRSAMVSKAVAMEASSSVRPLSAGRVRTVRSPVAMRVARALEG